MMIGFAAQNGVGAVELFDKKDADELVGEGHLRQGYLLTGQGMDGGIEAVGAADHEDKTTGTASHALLQPPREIHGATLGTMFIQQDEVVARLQLPLDERCFLCLLLLGGEGLGVPQLRDDLEGEGHIVREALGVVFDERLHVRVGGFAYDEESELQFELRVES